MKNLCVSRSHLSRENLNHRSIRGGNVASTKISKIRENIPRAIEIRDAWFQLRERNYKQPWHWCLSLPRGLCSSFLCERVLHSFTRPARRSSKRCEGARSPSRVLNLAWRSQTVFRKRKTGDETMPRQRSKPMTKSSLDERRRLRRDFATSALAATSRSTLNFLHRATSSLVSSSTIALFNNHHRRGCRHGNRTTRGNGIVSRRDDFVFRSVPLKNFTTEPPELPFVSGCLNLERIRRTNVIDLWRIGSAQSQCKRRWLLCFR